MNDKLGREGGPGDDRFRNDPRYTRSRESDGGFWEHGEEDRVLRSPEQEFETSAGYRQPEDAQLTLGRGSDGDASSAGGEFQADPPTDQQIRSEVCERLRGHEELTGSEVTVRVKQRQVTLEGTVETRHMKRLASLLAEQVAGVLVVRDELLVGEPT